METQELSAHLRAATEELEPSPGFTTAVVRGGRRRRTRYRAGVATVAAAAVAFAGGITYSVVRDDTVMINQVMAGWLAGPTKGDLAGDQPFLDQAVAAWEAGKARSPSRSAGVFDDVRGAPHVYWAGNTPAGRAAVVMQEAYLHPHEQLPPTAADTTQALVGLVATDPADGRFKLVADQFQTGPGQPLPGAFSFGEDDLTLLVVDRPEPVWAARMTRDESVEGEIRLETAWERVPEVDGVAMTKSTDAPALAVHTSHRRPAGNTRPNISDQSARVYLDAVEAGGTGPLVPTGTNELGWAGSWDVGADIGFDADPFYRLGQVYPFGSATNSIIGELFISAGLGNGRAFVVAAVAFDGEPWQLAGVEVDANGPVGPLVRGKVLNRNVPLPVTFELPDGKGWVIAAKDRDLSYRTDGDWVKAGKSAALVPADTTQVKVGDTVVDLH